MLSPEKKKELLAILQKEKERIDKVLGEFVKKEENVVGSLNSQFPDFNPGPGDMSEMSSEIEEYENRIALEHSLEKRLTEINEALKNINSSAYGTCEKCNGEISFERLRLNPATKLCAGCMG